MKTLPFAVAALLLAGCSGESPTGANATGAPANDTATLANVEEVPASEGDVATGAASSDTGESMSNAAVPAMTQKDYLGRWIGVEGMYLTVTEKPGGRGVTLDMQWDLDHKGTFDGSVTAEGLRFMRNGIAETAVPSAGDATGLKYLAGKTQCLTVKPGEGYCRD